MAFLAYQRACECRYGEPDGRPGKHERSDRAYAEACTRAIHLLSALRRWAP